MEPIIGRHEIAKAFKFVGDSIDFQKAGKYKCHKYIDSHSKGEKVTDYHTRGTFPGIASIVKKALELKEMTVDDKREILEGYRKITKAYVAKSDPITFFFARLFGWELAKNVGEAQKLINEGLEKCKWIEKNGTTYKKDVLKKEKITHSDGTVYEGEFEKDVLKKGKITHPDGTVEDGCFDDNGKLDGKGTKKCSNGVIEQGEFKHGNLLNNEYNLSFPNGVKIEKFYDASGMRGIKFFGPADLDPSNMTDNIPLNSDGQKDGKGKLTIPGGVTFDCEFKNDRIVLNTAINYAYTPDLNKETQESSPTKNKIRKGIVFQNNGTVEKGEFSWSSRLRNGKVNYPFTLKVDQKIESEEGLFNEDGILKEGKRTYFNGQIEEGGFKQNNYNDKESRLAGSGSRTDPSGVIERGDFKDGNISPDHPWQVMFPNGTAVGRSPRSETEFFVPANLDLNKITYEFQRNPNGQKHGTGKLTIPGGFSFECEFKKDQIIPNQLPRYTYNPDLNKGIQVTEPIENKIIKRMVIQDKGNILMGEFDGMGKFRKGKIIYSFEDPLKRKSAEGKFGDNDQLIEGTVLYAEKKETGKFNEKGVLDGPNGIREKIPLGIIEHGHFKDGELTYQSEWALEFPSGVKINTQNGQTEVFFPGDMDMAKEITYEGEFNAKGERHGRGKLIIPGDVTMTCAFTNNQIDSTKLFSYTYKKSQFILKWNGKLTLPSGETQEGSFIGERIKQGKITYSQGDALERESAEGEFDRNGRLINGKICYCDNSFSQKKHEEGKFDEKGVLRDGDIQYHDSSRIKKESGKFSEKGQLIEGDRFYPASNPIRFEIGEVFDTQDKLIKGTRYYSDSNLINFEKGEFCEQNNTLIEGLRSYRDSSPIGYEKGEFDAQGKLIEGYKVYRDFFYPKIKEYSEEGKFDAQGKLIDGIKWEDKKRTEFENGRVVID